MKPWKASRERRPENSLRILLINYEPFWDYFRAPPIRINNFFAKIQRSHYKFFQYFAFVSRRTFACRKIAAKESLVNVIGAHGHNLDTKRTRNPINRSVQWRIVCLSYIYKVFHFLSLFLHSFRSLFRSLFNILMFYRFEKAPGKNPFYRVSQGWKPEGCFWIFQNIFKSS